MWKWNILNSQTIFKKWKCRKIPEDIDFVTYKKENRRWYDPKIKRSYFKAFKDYKNIPNKMSSLLNISHNNVEETAAPEKYRDLGTDIITDEK